MTQSNVDDPVERILRPIIEGQIKSFIKDHPSILTGVDWYKPSTDKTPSLVGSITKRIMGDLLSEQTRTRLQQALLPGVSGDANQSGVDITAPLLEDVSPQD